MNITCFKVVLPESPEKATEFTIGLHEGKLAIRLMVSKKWITGDEAIAAFLSQFNELGATLVSDPAFGRALNFLVTPPDANGKPPAGTYTEEEGGYAYRV